MIKLKKRTIHLVIFLLLLYIVLLIPDFGKPEIHKASQNPFAWNKDSLWLQLENDFIVAKQSGKPKTDSVSHKLFTNINEEIDQLQKHDFTATDTALNSLQYNFFSLAPYMALQSQPKDSLIQLYTRVRNLIKQQSQQWDMNDIVVRSKIYQLLYGMRAATEEVLLQSDSLQFDPILKVKEELSVTPSTNILGVTVHSGDLLLSRGGAEVSALISRGNDYPGNFSHVALVYIDEKTNKPYLIEAHIEKGVAISNVDQYVKDKKLRFMVLRLRNDLPAMIKDPMLPQKAAKLAYDEGRKRHIPYDFKMNFYDSSAMFCSEVGSYAYKHNGVQLWQGISTISSQGIVNWLNAFGVENFVTQMPSDLEYDPQLSVIAEWRDPETLLKDHIDNAVMDALITKANAGQQIDYNIWQLPVVRLLKGYCMIKNLFGGIGIIPEGMSATQALKNQNFISMYQNVKAQTQKKIDLFIQEKKYKPPYWQMVKLADEAADSIMRQTAK